MDETGVAVRILFIPPTWLLAIVGIDVRLGIWVLQAIFLKLFF